MDQVTDNLTEGWIAFTDQLPPMDRHDDGVRIGRRVLVTNNLLARDAFGRMSHVWLANPIRATSHSKEWVAFYGDSRIYHLTHWKDVGV